MPCPSWAHCTISFFLSTNAGKTWITNNIAAKNSMTLYCLSLLFYFSSHIFHIFLRNCKPLKKKLDYWQQTSEKNMQAGWCFEESCTQTQTRSWESRTGAVHWLIDGSVSLHFCACYLERRWDHVASWKEKHLSPSTYPSRGQGTTRMSVIFWFSHSA